MEICGIKTLYTEICGILSNAPAARGRLSQITGKTEVDHEYKY